MQRNVVIAGYARSPFHFANKGELATVRPDEMAAQVVRALLEKTGVDPAEVEDLILGCAFPEGEQGLNLARIVGFLAGLPLSVAGQTINRFCGSSMQAIHSAAGAIQMNAGEAFICAGVESMSRVPMMGFNPCPIPNWPSAIARPIYRWAKPPRTLPANTKSPAPSRNALRWRSPQGCGGARARALQGRNRADPSSRWHHSD